MSSNLEKIKEYWDERAVLNQNSPAATTDDVYLRELEISTLVEKISALDLETNSTVLDLGCGDGYTTISVAQKLINYKFEGVDYSNKMLANAEQRLENYPELKTRLSFRLGDVTKLDEVCGRSRYSLIMTDRCLINLNSLERQKIALKQISKHLESGAHYIAVENFIEGHNNMNEARRSIGITEIPVRWHNIYFTEKEFREIAESDFEIVEFINFSSTYYYATRVVYSGMCKMQNIKPDYHHDIHKLAINLPIMGDYSPIKMVILKRR